MSSSLSILNDAVHAQTAALAARFESEQVLSRLRSVMGVEPGELRPADDALIALGTEVNAEGEVTRNSFGVFDLARQAGSDSSWPSRIAEELEAIRARVHDAHGVPIRFLIWAGMGGSIEDKLAYQACGLLKGGPGFYALDSTDPAKLKAILQQMHERAGIPMAELLKSTLVVGMAMGMTSYEPVVNLEKLAVLFAKNGIDPAANFHCMTLPGSLLDRFAEEHGFARVPLQLDGGNTTAGRHSAPLTRGSLYPLGLAGVDLTAWIAATQLSNEDIQTAWKLAAFLHAQGAAGRDKVTLLLPRSWRGAALWTKQDFEESLGKSGRLGIKIVIGERVKTRFYHQAGEPAQDRCFLAVQLRGEPHPEAEGITLLRRIHYPVAVVTFPRKTTLAAWMQFVHYTVFGIAFLRGMNFVTQPSVELYKTVAAEIFAAGSAEAWNKVMEAAETWTPETYATALLRARERGATYAELTFFGDMRYSTEGQKLRKLLESIADEVFRGPLQMPVDVGEGPAINHSYHEMIIGQGGCFSTLLASVRQTRFPGAGYEPDYHMAQFAATWMALRRRNRTVVPLMIRDLEDPSLELLQRFFREAGSRISPHGYI